MQKVLVIGGTGFFGRLLIDDLLAHADCEIVVASRHTFHSSRFETTIANLREPASLERALAGVNVAICAAGPYQNLPTTLVELCLRRGIHYIDLSDDRAFVQKVRLLCANLDNCVSAVCTGWSTVSAMSGLLAKIATQGMRSVDSIRIQMAAGNRGARQTATIASLLHSVGQTFTVSRNGEWQSVTGWSEPRDFSFPSPIGKRRGYLVDVPDHEIFPWLFGARTVEFRAGSELQILNACMSLLRRTGLNWVRWSGLLQRAAAMLSWIGHDCGGIGVEASGEGTRRVCVVGDSRAERMAVMPASVVTARLLSGLEPRGLVSYADWLTEEQLRCECESRGFRLVVEES